MASPPRGRSERRSYLFRGESAPFQETGLPGPLAIVFGHRLAEAPGPRLRRPFGPAGVVLSNCFTDSRIVDAPPAKLLADESGSVTAIAARTDELFGESLFAQQLLRFERIEHAFDRICAGTP